jgi:hypothetical protein
MLSSPVYTEFHPRPPKSSPVSLFFPNVQPANLPTCLRCPNSSKILPHPRPFLCRQHYAPISSLAATRTNPPASVADKRLTPILTPLDATLTKNRGGRGIPNSPIQLSNVDCQPPHPQSPSLPRYLITSSLRSTPAPKVHCTTQGERYPRLSHSKCPKE